MDTYAAPLVVSYQVAISLLFKAEKVLDWKNSRFIFNDEELGSIVRKLERWYEIEVDPSLRKRHYYGVLDRHDTLEPISSP